MKDFSNIYQNYAQHIYDAFNGEVDYLLPALENGMMVERSFVSNIDRTCKYRPFAWIGIDSETGEFLYYKHCLCEDFIDTQAYPPESVIKAEYITERTLEEQIEYDKELWRLYSIIREYAFSETLTDEQKEVLRKYREIWEKTVLLDLKPYYEALSPEFFEWLSQF